jgi:uncharacterized protein (TIGR03118 family)
MAGNVYTGLAIAGTGTDTHLYAANNAAGTVDVFDSTYNRVTLTGNFIDPGPNPDGLAPFNVKEIGGQIYVTYATPGPDADEAGLGSGFVSIFDEDGTFVRRLTGGGDLSSPWGMTLAPSGFGEFSDALLVGNFSDEFGYINAFSPTSGAFLGMLADANGDPLVIPYMWELIFGNGAASDAGDLYFAAGIGDEEHGLFGEIAAAAAAEVPEPADLGLFGLGLLALPLLRRRKTA